MSVLSNVGSGSGPWPGRVGGGGGFCRTARGFVGRLGRAKAMDSQAQQAVLVGWFKPVAGRWREVCRGRDDADVWRQLLDLNLGSGCKAVTSAGQDPDALLHRRRAAAARHGGTRS